MKIVGGKVYGVTPQQRQAHRRVGPVLGDHLIHLLYGRVLLREHPLEVQLGFFDQFVPSQPHGLHRIPAGHLRLVCCVPIERRTHGDRCDVGNQLLQRHANRLDQLVVPRLDSCE